MHSVEQEFSRECNEGDSDDYLFSVESLSALHKKNSPKKIYSNMRLRDVTVTFQLDCSAAVNILPVDIYQQIFNDPQMKRLQHSQTTLVMFNKSELEPLGYVKVETLNPKNEQCFLTEYTVVPEGYTPLLGSESVQQFCLITVNADNIMSLSHTASMQPDLVSEFHDIFSGEGKLEGKLHLEMDVCTTSGNPSEESPFRCEGPPKTGTRTLSKDKHLTTSRCPDQLDILDGSR